MRRILHQPIRPDARGIARPAEGDDVAECFRYQGHMSPLDVIALLHEVQHKSLALVRIATAGRVSNTGRDRGPDG